MIIKIAVVEDEDSSAKVIDNYVKKYSEESGEVFEIKRFTDGNEILIDYNPVFHIIFMDIQMKRLDGMATAEYIRKLDKDVILIFVTNMAQYAIKGYSVGALDFLLKPVSYFAFSQLLKHSVERTKKKQDSFILLNTDIGTVKMNLSEVVFIESFNHKMVVHAAGNEYMLSKTMSELEKELSGSGFFRCSKSYLVNMGFIKAVKGNTVILDKYSINLGVSKKKAFMEALTAYMGGK